MKVLFKSKPRTPVDLVRHTRDLNSETKRDEKMGELAKNIRELKLILYSSSKAEPIPIIMRYVSSRDNLRMLVNFLRESSKSIQIEAFPVFKLFAANQNKPPETIRILVANKNKLLRLFADFKFDKGDEQFEAYKPQVVREISALDPGRQFMILLLGSM